MSAVPLPLPTSREAIAEIQRARKRVAVERARRSAFLAPRVAGVDPARLDDPDEWTKIPLLTKDELRALPPEDFYGRFCVEPRAAAREYWRSGGATGTPLFYPRSTDDLPYCLLGFRRVWGCIGARAGDTVHDAFPMGIHPIGQMIARSAQAEGLGVLWAGAGTTTPSLLQLDLIQSLRPTIWAGMSSYALHLANLAEAQGIDLAASSVRIVLTSAEQLTAAKRAKLERAWGARVHDSFGMTEATMMAAESDGAEGLRVWTDMFLLEVVDEVTGKPLPEGEVGALVVTPLWTNHVTPFLRWLSGDIVSLHHPEPDGRPFSVFPVLRHAHRTTGFFKVRGVNVNHTEFEDFMFRQASVVDFRAELYTRDGLEGLRVLIEVMRDAEPAAMAAAVAASVKRTFEITPDIQVIERGTLAREFEKSVKAPRFVDARA